MKMRTLIVLFVLLAVLIAVARLISGRSPSSGAGAGAPKPGDLALPGFDVNSAARVAVISVVGTSTVAKIDGVWVVPGEHGYPVDFPRFAEQMRKIGEMKVGQVVRGGGQFLGELGLAPTSATQVVFYDAAGKEFARVSIGRLRASAASAPPYSRSGESQYVRMGDGPVVLVDVSLQGLPLSDAEWANRNILNVNSFEVAGVTVGSGAKAYTVRVPSPGSFEMDGLAEGESVDSINGGRLVGALQFVSFSRVADPSMTDADLGFDAASSFTLTTRDGMAYDVQLGKPAPGGDGRYARIHLDYEPPALPGDGDTAGHEQAVKEARENVDAQNALFDKWTYVLAQQLCDSMTLPRVNLIRTGPPEARPPMPGMMPMPPQAGHP